MYITLETPEPTLLHPINTLLLGKERGERITIFKTSSFCLHCYCEFGVWLLVCLLFFFFLIWLLFLWYLQFLKLFEPKQHLSQLLLVIRKVCLILFILSEHKSRLWAWIKGQSQRTDLSKEIFKIEGNMALFSLKWLNFENCYHADSLFLNRSVGEGS